MVGPLFPEDPVLDYLEKFQQVWNYTKLISLEAFSYICYISEINILPASEDDLFFEMFPKAHPSLLWYKYKVYLDEYGEYLDSVEDFIDDDTDIIFAEILLDDYIEPIVPDDPDIKFV